MPDYLFFYGHTPKNPEIVDDSCFSQWYPAPFTRGGVTYLTAEHFMMAEKAIIFDDLESYDKIIKASEPRDAKMLGRLVRNYDEQIWESVRLTVVGLGSYYKFSQNPHLAKHLLATGDKILVEASPYDKIWGIGLSASDPRAKNKNTWQGSNLLGEALMITRNRLQQNLTVYHGFTVA